MERGTLRLLGVTSRRVAILKILTVGDIHGGRAGVPWNIHFAVIHHGGRRTIKTVLLIARLHLLKIILVGPWRKTT